MILAETKLLYSANSFTEVNHASYEEDEIGF